MPVAAQHQIYATAAAKISGNFPGSPMNEQYRYVALFVLWGLVDKDIVFCERNLFAILI